MGDTSAANGEAAFAVVEFLATGVSTTLAGGAFAAPNIGLGGRSGKRTIFLVLLVEIAAAEVVFDIVRATPLALDNCDPNPAGVKRMSLV